MNSRIKFFLTLALAAALLVAALPVVSNVRAQSEKVLVVGFSQEPDTLNGYYSAMAFGQWAMDLCVATLYDIDENGTPVPVLIAEVPTVENGGIAADLKSYTVKLKPDLKWSDGAPLTAADVVFTFQMIMEKKNNFAQAASTAAALESVEQVDDLTVKLTFKDVQPFPAKHLSNEGLPAVLPAHVYKPVFEAEGTLEQAEENQNPTVFSGPFKLAEWARGEALTYVPNENYVGGAPSIDRLVLRIFPDIETAKAALAAGDVQFLTNVAQADAGTLGALSPDIQVVQVFGGYIEKMTINMRPEDFPGAGHPALRDVKVRQALRLAMNREKIVTELLGGTTTVTDSLYAGTPYENKNITTVGRNVEEAARLLDEAGWVLGADGVREKDGVKLELRMNSTSAGWRQANIAVLQQDLAEIGVKTVLAGFPSTDYFGQFANGGTLATGQFDLGEYANNTVLTNIVNVSVDEELTCAQRITDDNPAGNNYSGYCNEEMDKLVEITKTSSDAKAAQEAADKIQEILANDVPVILLFPRGDIYGILKSKFAEAPRIGSGVGNQFFDIVNWKLN
ncbi:MAG TPA: peptide ABC transporter substrate-binding protein [Aggregatilineales bacterium]|nr:peptide ABC transporter substrate-binding protein [Anaerolineales bacterium]HRE47008.1 peptide ABC transporter substrate-binding protein [Aggregatilineales bacterium]